MTEGKIIQGRIRSLFENRTIPAVAMFNSPGAKVIHRAMPFVKKKELFFRLAGSRCAV
jgi:hypothetical protein